MSLGKRKFNEFESEGEDKPVFKIISDDMFLNSGNLSDDDLYSFS